MLTKLKGKFGILFLKLFSTYILFLLIPIFVFSLLFSYNVMDSFEEQVSIANLSKIDVMRNSVEAVFEELIRNSLNISINKDLNDLYFITENVIKGDYDRVSTILDVFEILSTMEKTNNNIHSIYLYNEDTDSILTSESEIAIVSEFYDTAWIADLNRNGYGQIIMNTRLPIDEKYLDDFELQQTKSINYSEKVITLIYPLSAYTSKVKGAIAVNILEDTMNHYISSTDWEAAGYTMVSKIDGDIIIRNVKVEQDEIENIADEIFFTEILNSNTGSGYLQTEIEGEKYLATYTKSSFHDWIYLDLTPVSILFQELRGVQRIMYAIFAAVILLGVLISYFLSKRLYNPVKAIVQRVVSDAGFKPVSGNSEMLVLNNAVNYIIKEGNQKQQLFESNRKTIQENYYLSLLRGDVQDNPVQNSSESNIYCCIVATIDYYELFEKKYSDEEQYYFKLIIARMFEEIIKKQASGGGVVILELDTIAVIVNLDENGADGTAVMTEICQQATQELESLQEFSVSLGVGNLYEGREYVKKSFFEAVEALKYKILFGAGSIIQYNQITNRSDTNYFPATLEKHILNYLKLNSLPELKQVIVKLIADVKGRKDLDYTNVMQVFTQLTSSAINHLTEEHIRITDIFSADTNLLRELNSKETLDDIQEWLIDFFTAIVTYQNTNLDSDKKHMVRIIDFIERNYARSEMDINLIVDETSLSYSHLRKIFKDNIGENLIDYLNKLRITQSKKMLRGTNLTINDIAQRVGYNNDRSFTRNFKKYEGITPGEFRNINKS